MRKTRLWLVTVAWLLAPAAGIAQTTPYYYRIDDFGSIVRYDGFDALLADEASQSYGSISTYGDDPGFFYDPSRNSYFRVEDGGAVLEYATLSDFLSNTNATLHVTVPTYGNDSGFFYDPDRNSYFRIEDLGFILEYGSFAAFLGNAVATNYGQVLTYSGDADFFFDIVRETYVRVEDGGAIVEYPTFADFVSNSNGVPLTTVAAYGNDRGFFVVSAPSIPALPAWERIALGLLLLVGGGYSGRRFGRTAPRAGGCASARGRGRDRRHSTWRMRQTRGFIAVRSRLK